MINESVESLIQVFQLSFLRKWESRFLNVFWIPAYQVNDPKMAVMTIRLTAITKFVIIH